VDVIKMINGQRVDSANRLRNVISSMAPGSEAVVTVARQGYPKDLQVQVGEFQASHFGITNPDPRASNSGPKLGMAVESLTPDTAVQLGLEERSGLVVRAVDPAWAAEQAGINIGDVIVEVNRKAVKTASELETLVRSAGDEPIPLLVNRGGRTFFIVVKPG
jgi:S1-C subfamily serine protease